VQSLNEICELSFDAKRGKIFGPSGYLELGFPKKNEFILKFKKLILFTVTMKIYN
jgi:hypothetical protein